MITLPAPESDKNKKSIKLQKLDENIKKGENESIRKKYRE